MRWAHIPCLCAVMTAGVVLFNPLTSIARAQVAPDDAMVVAIVTTAPLPDHSERSVEAAFHDAVQAAVTEAMAMGLPWVQFSQALVLEDAVRVEILATGAEPDAGPGKEAQGAETARRAGVDPSPDQVMSRAGSRGLRRSQRVGASASGRSRAYAFERGGSRWRGRWFLAAHYPRSSREGWGCRAGDGRLSGAGCDQSTSSPLFSSADQGLGVPWASCSS